MLGNDWTAPAGIPGVGEDEAAPRQTLGWKTVELIKTKSVASSKGPITTG